MASQLNMEVLDSTAVQRLPQNEIVPLQGYFSYLGGKEQKFLPSPPPEASQLHIRCHDSLSTLSILLLGILSERSELLTIRFFYNYFGSGIEETQCRTDALIDEQDLQFWSISGMHSHNAAFCCTSRCQLRWQ